MTDIPLTPEEQDEALAAEYVLGLGDLAERMAAEARAKTDAGFAARIAAWETRLSLMNDEFEPAAAPDLLPAIEARLFGLARNRRRWFARFAWAAAAAAIVLFAAFEFLPAGSGALVAEMATQSGDMAYEVRYDTDHLVITRVAGTRAPAGQDHELWIIAPGQNPVSLGVLGDAPLLVEYPRPPVGWVLAVTVETAGGSPTGAPQGPLIMKAEIHA